MAMPVTLRPVQLEDQVFLFDLYASTRADEMAIWGWDAAQQVAFLTQQFRAQQQHYKAQYPDAEHCIIRHNDCDVGGIMTAELSDMIVLVDIALLPEERGHGIGTTLIQDLQTRSVRTGKPLHLHVLSTNHAATRLYQRLCFRTICHDEPYFEMEWSS